MNLILCGMMGAGKTTVGKRLATLLGLRFADTDELITARYGKISDIFKNQGESRFREMEEEVAKQLANEDGLVLATGGGFFLSRKNEELLRKNGKIIYLFADVETLRKRLAGDCERPLLQGETTLFAKLERLFKERENRYKEVADEIILTDGLTAEEVAVEVVKRIKK